MSFVRQTTYSLDPYLLNYFWTWLFWGPHSGWPKFFSVFYNFPLLFEGSPLCGFIAQRSCFWKHLAVTPVGKLSFLSKLAGVIFCLNSTQNWSFVWDFPIGFQAHLQHPSQMILFRAKIEVLNVLNAKIVSVATFQRNPAEMISGIPVRPSPVSGPSLRRCSVRTLCFLSSGVTSSWENVWRGRRRIALE